ncbi:MAG: rhodanese-like domain-containing protein [Pegethrix bostrychoides GSE-TBD4-15B]|jgi:rhodanese-related sulfurtransferase|uniref:Rhodanese-like domain-containing protein n=1 Tax=Pegethrix bostrychoides GSE-TBD4-15B TaxID=2839662 RepID=A0A951U771_9CYAN|nr:rhodanese-like domain-containing protein [Pegethrix bostrychoides GSE-TBD4-15B]
MKTTSANNQSTNPISLTPAQLKSSQNELLVVDIRGWFEYWMGHIPGAERSSQNRILQEIPKDQSVAITCLSGYRSAIAAQWLVAQGYRQVYNLQGGLLAWQSAGYTVQRGNYPQWRKL